MEIISEDVKLDPFITSQEVLLSIFEQKIVSKINFE